MENKNELTIVEQNTLASIDETLKDNSMRIMARDGSKVFPITVPLRKKLEALKEQQLGDVKTQLKYIRAKKYDEFLSINKSRITKLKSEISRDSKKLTQTAYNIMKKKRKADFDAKIKYANEAKGFYKELEKITKLYPDMLKIEEDYDFPLKNFKPKKLAEDDFDYDEDEAQELSTERAIIEYRQQLIKDRKSYKIGLNEDDFTNKVLKKEFEDKFGEGFRVAEQKINDLEKQYNESLLFGDMEVVKKVYYNLKEAEKFLTMLDKMKLK